MTPDRAAVFQDQARQELQRVFESHLPPEGLRTVLDAGCGYKLPIDVPRDVHLTGIDVSEEAMAKNSNADELILGDLQSYPLPAGAFDAVICWWVLEHLPRPLDAIANVAQSLRPGGLLVLGIPQVGSMKALLTKATPFRFHVWALKNIFGVANAGQPGVEPYPTFLRWDLAPTRLQRALAGHQLAPVYTVAHRSGDETRLPTPLRALWNALASVGSVLTRGRWDPHADEFVAIFRKETTPDPLASDRVVGGESAR